MLNQDVTERLIQEQRRLRLGPPLDEPSIASIERKLHLAFNKWDTQVGDTAVLSSQPVLISQRDWIELQRIAEALATEVQRHELHVMQNENVQKYIGVPRLLRAVLANLRERPVSNLRYMRFDFHPTSSGWYVSEVNADVPGGWREATSLPDLFRTFYPQFGGPPSPLAAWSDAVGDLVGHGYVALLSAPGFLEDLQVIYAFQRELSRRGTQSVLVTTPAALDWSSGACRTRSSGVDISLIVRFYQIEWLARLSRSTRWRDLLLSDSAAIVNPTIAVISESKRFPLAFSRVEQNWQTFVPESRDPRLVDSSDWDNWVLKAAYSNTGDSIHFCSEIPEPTRRHVIRTAQSNPLGWVAQRRFDTIPLDSERGPLYPCIGVFVVNGQAAGAYARLSASRTIDGAAIEAPVLID